jgi:alkaline phosphatase D
VDERRTSAVIFGSGFSRRDFLKGGLAIGLLAGVGGLGADFWFDAGWAFADGPTVGLGPGTAPEQVHLTWGGDPRHEVTVSWASPGATPQPGPALAYGNDPAALVTHPYHAVVEAVTFQDGLNLESVHWYHASLHRLEPGRTYYCRVSDGAAPPTTVNGSFTTAPAGRAPFRFTSYGDLATPTAHLNASGHTWQESSDNSWFAVAAVETSAPLFHLLNGDLCYANLNTNNQPEVWRDFGVNISRSARNRPWMPTLGNHEIEFGTNAPSGTGPGIWNGRFGYGSYQTRFQLPDNGVPGYRGNFYRFQVGSVLFICLDADDVIYQDGGSFYAPAASTTAPLTATNPAVAIPPGSSTYNNSYTGALTPGPDEDLVPDLASGRPNQQTLWLARTLRQARRDGTVDMIVVVMHQCALSSSKTGNGSDLGIRQAWLPLFDRYRVDLVLSGHEHNYERSYPVRGYDPGSLGTIVAPNPGQAPAGTPVFTRRPSVVDGAATSIGGIPAFDTLEGTVFLVLGGGGTDGPTNTYGVDAVDGSPQAKVITTRNLIHEVDGHGNPVSTGSPSAVGWVKDGADSVEDAAWSAQRDPTDAYGLAVFDVDPGRGPGRTTITMTYFHAPQAGGNPSAGNKGFVGPTSYSPFEQALFGRGLARQRRPTRAPGLASSTRS